MCGISAGVTLDRAFELYELNLERGVFSSGILAAGKDHFFLDRIEGTFTKDQLESTIPKNLNAYYYLFHSRAPTNTTAPWSINTTHPFSCGHYFAAQNGIIQNFSSFTESRELEVDSSIIPVHLNKFEGDVKKTFEAYTGLLTAWMYCSLDNTIKVVKAGSSLYVDNSSFSSSKFDGGKEVEDGVILQLIDSRLEQVDTFKYSNPYFIL